MCALSGSSSYSMSRFLGSYSEAFWTLEARRESHDDANPSLQPILQLSDNHWIRTLQPLPNTNRNIVNPGLLPSKLTNSL